MKYKLHKQKNNNPGKSSLSIAERELTRNRKKQNEPILKQLYSLLNPLKKYSYEIRDASYEIRFYQTNPFLTYLNIQPVPEFRRKLGKLVNYGRMCNQCKFTKSVFTGEFYDFKAGFLKISGSDYLGGMFGQL